MQLLNQPNNVQYQRGSQLCHGLKLKLTDGNDVSIALDTMYEGVHGWKVHALKQPYLIMQPSNNVFSTGNRARTSYIHAYRMTPVCWSTLVNGRFVYGE